MVVSGLLKSVVVVVVVVVPLLSGEFIKRSKLTDPSSSIYYNPT